ncbi:MAG TPA: HAMP domain-containing protein, partial [Rubrivivax sp.]|nr:HAMP domain-containing protein [Rubrivivax sp.]
MKRLIGNLKMWQKFALIGALAVCMVTPPTALVVRANWEKLQTARAEASGMAPAGEVLKLIQATQQHRGISAGLLGGDTAARALREGKQAEVETRLTKAYEVLSAFGDAKLLQELDALKRDWQSVAGAVGSGSISSGDSFARHTALVAAQLELLTGIADASTLALDPEAASYYLTTAVFTHVPQVSEAMGQARGRGALLLARGTIKPEDRVLLTALTDSARPHIRNARAAFDKAMAADPALAQGLEKPLATASSAMNTALKLIDEKMVKAEVLTLSSADYRKATTTAIDTQFELLTAAFTALDRILIERSAAARNELIGVAGLIGGFAALALWVIVIVTRTTTRSVAQAVDAAEALARGDLNHHIEVSTRDEMGQLLTALQASMAKLAKVVVNIKASSESVGSAAVHIAQGNIDLSQRTEEQASNLQQTAASMEELTTTVKNSAASARDAA